MLRDLHEYYGHFLQLVPLAVLAWALLKRKGKFQRLAPIALDVNVALGLIVYLFSDVRVSIWHPIAMFAAIGIAHGVSRTENRKLLIGAWIVVLLLVVVGIQVASGNIPGLS